jgi:hypothetical protein
MEPSEEGHCDAGFDVWSMKTGVPWLRWMDSMEKASRSERGVKRGR